MRTWKCAKGLALVVVSLFITINAKANIIDLGAWDIPSGGESAAKELAFLNSTVLPAYNAAHNPDLLAATFGTENINVPDDDILSIALDVTGWSYVKLKWGKQWQFYSVAGESGSILFASTVLNPNEIDYQALSHYTFFGPETVHTPDGGSTLLLLGSALIGVGLIRRKLSSK